MRIFLTGGTGFVGSALSKQFVARQHTVYGLSRSDSFAGNVVDGVEYVKGDLLEAPFLEASIKHIQPDIVVHLAAYTPVRFSFDNPIAYAHANYIGTMNLVEAIRKCGGIKQLVYACYDKDTFAYTLEGLKGYWDLRIGQKVLSLNGEGQIEVDTVTAIHTYPYDGDLLHFKGKSSDLLVTSNHRMLFRGKTSNRWQRHIKTAEAQQLLTKSEFALPSGTWKGLDQAKFSVDGVEYPTEDLFYLVGLYIGDGHSNIQVQTRASKSGLTHHEYVKRAHGPDGRFVELGHVGPAETTQLTSFKNYLYVPDADKSRKKAEATLERLAIPFSRHKKENYGTVLYIGSEPLLSFFHAFGKVAHDKHVPAYILNYAPRHLKRLLEGILDSDGSRNRMVSTASWELAQDLIELGTKLGLGVTLSEHRGPPGKIRGRAIQGGVQYQIYFRRTEKGIKRQSISKEAYIGKVWCVTVEKNHNLLVCRNGKTTFSGNSTAEIYGPYAEDQKRSEESLPTPSTPDAISKLAGEHYIKYAAFHDVNFTVLRPTNTFGRTYDLPDEARGYFIEKLIIGMLSSPHQTLPFDGSPDSKRRFMYVSDHVGAYTTVVGNGHAYNRTYNVAPADPALKLSDVVDIVREVTDFRGELSWMNAPRPLEPNYLDIDPFRIMHELGWHSRVSLKQGLEKTVEYWKKKLMNPP